MINKLFKHYTKKHFSTAKATLLIAMELCVTYVVIAILYQVIFTAILGMSVNLDTTLTTCVFAFITAVVIDGGAINISKIIKGDKENKNG